MEEKGGGCLRDSWVKKGSLSCFSSEVKASDETSFFESVQKNGIHKIRTVVIFGIT